MPRFTPSDALARFPGPGGERSARLFGHGTLEIKLYAPRGKDPQQPHARDEVYFVAAGRGTFVDGAARYAFGPGDLLFVPAGVVHRFEDFTDDLAVWVSSTVPRAARPPLLDTRDALRLNAWLRGRLAQLVEHLLDKQGVTGSSPVSPTMFPVAVRQADLFPGFRPCPRRPPSAPAPTS